MVASRRNAVASKAKKAAEKTDIHPQYGTHFKTLPNGMLVRITESEVRPIAGYDQKEYSGRIYITRNGKKGEEVVGFTEYHPGKLMGVGDVTLYSEHEKHREEINRAVHEAAEKLAKKHGSNEILVTVPVKTVPVHEHEGKLLKANGFKPRRELDGHFDYYTKEIKKSKK